MNASPDNPDNLLDAIKAGDVDRAASLLDEDPSLVEATTDDGLSLFHVTAQYGYSGRTESHKPIVDLLLARGLEPDVFACAYLRMTDRGRQLIADDPSLVRETAPDGSSALHFAAELGGLEMTRALIEAGADVDLADNRGETPLLRALHAGPWKPAPADDVVEYLLSRQRTTVLRLPRSSSSREPTSTRPARTVRRPSLRQPYIPCLRKQTWTCCRALSRRAPSMTSGQRSPSMTPTV